MVARIIDGKMMASKIREEMKERVLKLKEERGIVPGLAIALVGSDESSRRYVELKAKQAREAGAVATIHSRDHNVKNEELMELIRNLNDDGSVHGILVQLPLPSHLDENSIISMISPEKDVDGLTPATLGRIMIGEQSFGPAGAEAVREMLMRMGITIQGKRAVIGGTSNILGRPLASMLTNEKAIVTLIPSPNNSFIKYSREAEILVIDFAMAKWVKSSMVAEGSIVIDAGNNYIDGKVFGDVDYEDVKDKAGMITPVPGGLGPMLVATLIKNLVTAAEVF